MLPFAAVHAQPAIKPKPVSAKYRSKRTSGAQSGAGSKDARDEIYTYIAIRDLLLSDAEAITTAESLRRATIANEFVETCLQPPRSPYEAQHLREIEAARERQRCGDARACIAALGRKLD